MVYSGKSDSNGWELGVAIFQETSISLYITWTLITRRRRRGSSWQKKNWPTATNLAEENPLDSWWFPESWGYPQSSSSSRWDVPWHKPSILGTPIDGNHHINLHQRHRASHLHTISVFADVLQMVPYLARGNSAQKDIYLPQDVAVTLDADDYEDECPATMSPCRWSRHPPWSPWRQLGWPQKFVTP